MGLVSYQRDSSRDVTVFAVILAVADVPDFVDVPTAAVTGGLVHGCPYVAGVPGVDGFSALPGLSIAKEKLTLLIPLFLADVHDVAVFQAVFMPTLLQLAYCWLALLIFYLILLELANLLLPVAVFVADVPVIAGVPTIHYCLMLLFV